MTTPSTALPVGGERWIVWTAVMFIAAMLTLVRAFLAVKLFFLGLFLLSFVWAIYRKRVQIVSYQRLFWFYLWICVAGLVWAFVGLLHPTNYSQAVYDALRLYVVWSVAFFVLYTFFRSVPSLRIFHVAMVASGILIPLINFVGLYDQYSGLGLISDNVRDQLGLEIGIWDSYLQFSSINILSILLVSYLTDSYGLLRIRGRRVLLAWVVASITALATLIILPEGALDVGSITRFQQAFSSEDARTIQKPYLIGGFLKSPLLGSGFGGRVAYIRSDEQPWGYELTYYQMLFNLGTVGMTVLGTLFVVYIGAVVRLLRQFREGSVIPFGLLIAFFSLLAGAYSDPYFGGFDSLFFAGLLPYLSTFQRGFADQQEYDLWSAGLVARG